MYKKIKDYTRRYPAISLSILFIISIIAFFAFTLPVLSFIVGVILSYLFSRFILNSTFFPTKVFVFAVSLFGYMSILQISAYLGAAISESFDIELTLLVTQLIYSILVLLVVRRPVPKINLVGWFDYTALGVSIIFASVIICLPIYKSGNIDDSSVVELINSGVDDSLHLTLINQRIDSKRGVFTSDSQINHPRFKSNVSYPGGWHAANATIMLAITPSIKPGYDTIVAYAISKIYWIAYLTFVITATCGILFGTIVRKNRALSIFWLTISSLFFAFWFTIFLPRFGFYNFTPILTAAPLMILSIAAILKAKSLPDLSTQLILPVLVTCTVALSWVLISPAFALAGLLATATLRSSTFAWKKLPTNYSDTIALSIVVISSAFAILMQIGLTSTISEQLSFKDSITAAGGIVQFPAAFYLFLLIMSYPFVRQVVVGKNKGTHTSIYQSILIVIVSLLLFTSSLYVLQIYLAGTTSYYFYKPLTVVVLGLIIAGIVGVGRMVTTTSHDRLSIAALISIYIMLGATVVYPNSEFAPYATNKYTLPPQVSDLVTEKFKSNYSNDSYFNQEVTVFISSQSAHVNTEIGNMILKSNKPYSQCFDYLHTVTILNAIENINVPMLDNKSCDNYKVTIYTGKPEAKRLTNEAIQSGILNYQFKPTNP